jgi:general secretion pathway protein D
MFVALLLLVTGCVTAQKQGTAQLTQPDIATQIREVDLSPKYVQRMPSPSDGASAAGAHAQTYYGEETAVAGSSKRNGKQTGPNSDPATTGALGDGKTTAASEKGYEVNFENAPIRTVAKAVLGDILSLGYTIDPRVQGTVNLSSGRPIPKRDLLFAFESALRTSNVALIRDGQAFRLIPSPDAVGGGSIDAGEGPEAGYGISVIPLQFVSAQTLAKLLENFSNKPGMVRPEPSRNLLVIQGSGADRRAAIDTALSFDADWMRGQSVGIYPVINSTLEPIIAELERIVDSGENGLSQNVVKLQPIARQNAILVVARKPALLKTVATWIQRLDKTGGAGASVRVYRMRYGDARQTAALLNDIFLGNSASGVDSPTNQLVPGGNPALTASSARPNLNASQPAQAPQQESPTSNSTNFGSRFADASGGRTAQTTAPNTAGAYGRSAGIGNGQAPVGPGPILPNVRISADAVNNALLIYANQENYRVIERTLNQLDRPQLQVSIDATIAEITLNDQLQYGVQFFLNSKDVGLGANKGSVINTAIKDTVLSRVLPGFNFLVGTEAQPRLILDALHQVTDVKILSTPSVVVVDNQSASLQVGDQIPITTRTAQSVDVPTAPVVNSIDYRNTGVILKVAPRINANGNVLLDIEQEISAVSPTDTANTLTPTVSQRKVRSTIAVASGQTVLLGGLISERRDRGRSGIPGFDQIPGVGELFSQNSGQVQRTELVIFIRPQIIRNGMDAARIASELRAKMQGLRPRSELAPAAVKPFGAH